MRRVAQTMAVTGAVLGLGLTALPATAGTMAAAAAARTGHAARTARSTVRASSPAQQAALRRAQRISTALRRQGSVTGLVRGPSGAPEPNVCVRVIGSRATRIGFTRPDGRFVIDGLPVGGYRIEYRGCSLTGSFAAQWYGGLTRASAARVPVTAGAPAQVAPVTLGRIAPMFEQSRAEAAPAAQRASAVPGLTSVARIAALLGTVKSGAAGSATMTASPARAGQPRITGAVTNQAGRPLAGVCVLAVQPSGKRLQVYGEGVTSKSGRYGMRVFATGRFIIDFLPLCGQKGNYAPQLWKAAASAAASTVVRVRAHQVVGHIDAVLRTGAQIAGKLRAAGSRHPSFSGLCVEAEGTGGQRLFLGQTTVRSDGSFLLPSLSTGAYRLAVSAADCGRSSPYLPMILRKTVQVTDGKTTAGVSAALRIGGSITGTVKDTGGHLLFGICVETSHGGQFFGARTGHNGRYLLEGLTAGSYKLQFGPGCGANGGFGSVTLTAQVMLGKTTAGVNAVLPEDGSISGVVKNSGGTPLGGICVAAVGSGSNPGFAFTMTAANGTYRARKLPPGGYQVQFVPGGAFSDCANKGNYLPVTDSATVASGATTTLDAVLQTGGVITGVVRDAHGHPLSGVCVFASGASFFGGQVRTRSDGSYRIKQLGTGSYDLGFEGGCGNTVSLAPQAYRGDPTFLSPTPVSVTAGDVTSGIGATMRPGGTITGRVTDQSGRPVGTECVLIEEATGAGADGQLVDLEVSRHGTYTSTNLPPGQYQVVFSGTANHGGCGNSRYADQQFGGHPVGAAADLVSVAAGRLTRGVGAVLTLAGQISGVVTSAAGHPLSEICVDATNPETGAAGETFTVQHGRYILPDLPAGRYKVEFSNCGADLIFFGPNSNFADQWYKDKPTSSGAALVTVSVGHTTPDINAALNPGGAIRGQVSYRPTGRPISLVCVFAIAPDRSSGGLGVTNRRGDYAISGLSTGRYLVEFEPCDPESALAGQVKAGTVHVAAGHSTRNVSEKLAVGGSASGTVSYTASGAVRPAPGTCVEVLPLSPTSLGVVTIAGPGGSYLAPNLAPGAYFAIFGDPGCSTAVPTLSQRLSGRIVVRQRQTTAGVNVTLKVAGGISGVVRGPGGGKLTGICAEAVPAAGGPGAVVGITTSGEFSIGDLQPGRYKVEFTVGCGATGYATRWYAHARSRAGGTVVVVKAGAVHGSIDATLPRG